MPVGWGLEMLFKNCGKGDRSVETVVFSTWRAAQQSWYTRRDW